MSYPQIDQTNETVKVKMETNHGDMIIALYGNQAPKTVKNFVTHCENGYYDGLTFHRIIKQFMLQGGDPSGNGTGGESIYGAPFEDEFSPELFHFQGALSMANSGPNTNGSQFFIVQNSELNPQMAADLDRAGYPAEAIQKYKEVGGTPWLDHRHTVFGQVVEGMDIVHKIADLPTLPTDQPMEKVVMTKVRPIMN
ncbi:peptidylprolyl isomerase [Bacillus fonticola]|uniref:peptidylprolyl isomerase n=1 Tax=Bacillus fonticola TaxID=2728853 RepID=UPI001472AE5C|nr:peptidylprolyl isomerase [Bacillus fonticola]